MKKLFLIACLALPLVACEKDDKEMEVKFSVTGTEVNEVKFNYKSTLNSIATPFTGTRDTTIYANIGETISLDAKATGGSLKGQIFVNGLLAAEQIDADSDNDGKAHVKVDWTVK
jgi:hypothetical protein